MTMCPAETVSAAPVIVMSAVPSSTCAIASTGVVCSLSDCPSSNAKSVTVLPPRFSRMRLTTAPSWYSASSSRATGRAAGSWEEVAIDLACHESLRECWRRMDDPIVSTPLFDLSVLDAVEWLRAQPAESLDLVITDPAYESLEKHRAIGTTTRLKHSKGSSNDWFAVFPNARFAELFDEAFRVLKRNTHLYLFCDAETMFVAKPEAERAGFRFWKPLVWDKKTIGMGYHYRARYEFILFFEKGKRRLADLGIADVISVPRIHRGYPAEKPPAVSEVLIKQSSAPGDVVADPFMGSGSVGVAALRAGRRFTGTDLNPQAVRLTADRLRQFGDGHAPQDLPEPESGVLELTDSAL